MMLVIIDKTNSPVRSYRHGEADMLGPSMLELTGSSNCRVPMGNHLQHHFDYLFLS